MISKDSELRAVGTKIRWNEVKERILQETQKVSTTWPIINALATGRRKTGVRLLEWVAEVHHLKVQLELTGGTLPEDFWFHYVWKRLTDTERRLVPCDESKYSELLSKVRKLKRELMPRYKQEWSSSFEKKLPRWPDDHKQKPTNRSKTMRKPLIERPISSPTSTHTKSCKHHPNAKSHDTSECSVEKNRRKEKSQLIQKPEKQETQNLRRSKRNTDQRVCYRCNQRGHIASSPECPQRAKVTMKTEAFPITEIQEEKPPGQRNGTRQQISTQTEVLYLSR
jgi:hypothetical protein